MKVVGLFRELERGVDASVPSIRPAVGQLAENVVPSLDIYLSNGALVFAVMGYSIDPLDQTKSMAGGGSLLTDGIWVWRRDLAYLVRQYRVGLPDDFISHALSAKAGSQSVEVTQELCDEAIRVYFLAEKGKGE